MFISGLFLHHFGKSRNIPIVRIGNLAALKEEKIATKSFGEIDGYLIEARSTGGLSGSSVFLNLGLVRFFEGRATRYTADTDTVYLLGLIHGHYPVEPKDVDAAGRVDALPRPAPHRWTGPYDLLVTGVGGTGVVTVGALVAMAARNP